MANAPELLQLLHDAHLTRVLIGIESLNQAALNSIHKGQQIQDIREAGLACEKYGIRVIASVVLGLDDDTLEDIRRSVAFAKEIHAYQLQPAILTPFPGTPVFEEFERQGRMITHDWTLFDMMQVTFRPKNMTPWELQEEFYRSNLYFYDFAPAKGIGETFGKEYGRRRWGLAFMARFGVWGAHFCSQHVPGTVYYQLRHYQDGDRDIDDSVSAVVHPVLSEESEHLTQQEVQIAREGKKKRETAGAEPAAVS